MKHTVLKFGFIAGGILGALMAVTVPLVIEDVVDGTLGQVIGYTTMIVAFLAVFFGIRAYRDGEGGGAITFGKAFRIGILIALIGCACYVAVWQVMYWGFFPDFAEKYGAAMIAKMQAQGKPAAEIAAAQQDMAKFARWYRNPLFNIAITFVEVFPVALIMTVVSAAILRRPRGATEPAMA